MYKVNLSIFFSKCRDVGPNRWIRQIEKIMVRVAESYVSDLGSIPGQVPVKFVRVRVLVSRFMLLHSNDVQLLVTRRVT